MVEPITYATTLQLLGGPQGGNEEGIQTLRDTRERWALAEAALVDAAGGPLFEFNDAEETTFDGIVDVLDRAIKGLE